MKKIEDLEEMDVIHCPTFEEWNAILALNPKNDVNECFWQYYKSESYYRPKGNDGLGSYSKISFAQQEGYRIHQASEFLPKAEKSLAVGFPDSVIEHKHLLKDTDLGYFAGLAMQGYISAGSTGMPDPDRIVSYAMETAKALIAELRKEVSNA